MVSGERLLRAGWGGNGDAGDDQPVLHSPMSRLRHKLEDEATAGRYLESLRGLGYRLPAPA